MTGHQIRACPACEGSGLRWARKQGHDLRHCARCGTVYVDDPQPAADLYAHYHDGAGFAAPEVVQGSLDRLVRSVEPFRSTGRWLDVGYGEGELLRAAESLGWRCYGTEVAPNVLAYGARRGWVVASDARDPRFPDAGFDVVTMVELLEHAGDPRSFLREARRLLRPGGLLYVTTPNALSLNRRLLGPHWSVFCPPEHLTIWTSQGLRVALASAGLRLVRARTEGLNPCEILARLRRGRGSPAPLDRNAAAVALSTALSRSALRRGLKSGVNHALSLFSLGDTLKAWAVRAPSPS